MPGLPGPLPFIPAGGDLPVSSEDDVRKVLPDLAQGPADEAPVREALVAAQQTMFERWQEASAYAAAQSDPTRATGIYLVGHAEDRELVKREGEDDEAFRERMFAPAELV